jgi:hypothetical protein
MMMIIIIIINLVKFIHVLTRQPEGQLQKQQNYVGYTKVTLKENTLKALKDEDTNIGV